MILNGSHTRTILFGIEAQCLFKTNFFHSSSSEESSLYLLVLVIRRLKQNLKTVSYSHAEMSQEYSQTPDSDFNALVWIQDDSRERESFNRTVAAFILFNVYIVLLQSFKCAASSPCLQSCVIQLWDKRRLNQCLQVKFFFSYIFIIHFYCSFNLFCHKLRPLFPNGRFGRFFRLCHPIDTQFAGAVMEENFGIIWKGLISSVHLSHLSEWF